MSTLKVNTIDAHSGSLLTIDSTADLSVASATSASSTTTGALKVTGGISTQENLYVGGNAVITGTMTANGGTITLGDAGTDNVTIGGEINSDVIPDVTNTYDLGSSSKKWAEVHATTVTGNLTGDVTGNVTATTLSGALTGNVTGNADTATTLAATKTIGGVAFDGSANINLAGVNTAGNQDTSGNATTATTLATARTLALSGDVSGSVSFDGSANATITATIADDSHNHTTANVDGLDTALGLKAPLASPALTGVPTAPTAAANTNTTQVATTAYVQTELTDLIGGAPGTLDTLNELAFAINDDASYASTLTTALATKTAKTSNQSLSSAANALTISGTTITLARGDSTTDTISIPAGYADSDVDSHLSGGSGITYSAGAISVTSGSITAAHLAANSVDSSELVDNGVDASHLNVTGNGTTSQFLRSDGDGSFSWVTPTDTNTTYSVGDGGLSEINFTTADNTKLDGIATSANNYSYPYSVDQSTATSSNVTFNNVTVAGTLTESSAAIYKENISPLQDQLANIMRLNPVEYDKKSSGAHEYGLIAGEVLEIYPDFVGTKDGKADSLNYSRMVSVLVKAVQELTQKVEIGRASCRERV